MVRHETRIRLFRGNQLVEMLKQFCGSPISLYQEVGILSLVNQEVIRDLAISNISRYVLLYIAVPSWLMLVLPVRIVAHCLLRLI